MLPTPALYLQENRFTLFDSVPLATSDLCFKILCHQKRDCFPKFLAELRTSDIALHISDSARNYVNWQFLAELRVSNVMFDY